MSVTLKNHPFYHFTHPVHSVLKGQLNEALKGEGQLHRLQRPDGRACGLVGWWPRRAVLFVRRTIGLGL